jgi:hypothetical protein
VPHTAPPYQQQSTGEFGGKIEEKLDEQPRQIVRSPSDEKLEAIRTAIQDKTRKEKFIKLSEAGKNMEVKCYQ